jgi:hypothetical protein
MSTANGIVSVPTECPKKKKCFRSREEAVSWEQANRQKYPHIAQQYAYACEDCPSWHLSAMPRESFGMAASRSSLKPIESAVAKASGRGRCSLEETERRYRIIWSVMDDNPGLSRTQLATKLSGQSGISQETAYQFLRNNEEQLSTRVLPSDAYHGRRQTRIPTTLERVAEKRLALEAQLTALKKEEQRLIEARSLKLTPCWEGNGILIQKEGSSLGLLLDDAKELAEKLMEYLTNPAKTDVVTTIAQSASTK